MRLRDCEALVWTMDSGAAKIFSRRAASFPKHFDITSTAQGEGIRSWWQVCKSVINGNAAERGAKKICMVSTSFDNHADANTRQETMVKSLQRSWHKWASCRRIVIWHKDTEYRLWLELYAILLRISDCVVAAKEITLNTDVDSPILSAGWHKTRSLCSRASKRRGWQRELRSTQALSIVSPRDHQKPPLSRSLLASPVHIPNFRYTSSLQAGVLWPECQGRSLGRGVT